MRALSASAVIQIPLQLSSPLKKQAFPITTTRKERTCFPQQLLSLRVVNSVHESSDFGVVPWAAAAAAAAAKLRENEKDDEEEVKSLLTLFLKELSLKDTIEFCKSAHFIDHLVAKLHSIHRIGFPVGRELTLVEIRDALIPAIESLIEENLDIWVKREKLPIPHQTINSSLVSIKPNDMVSVSSNIQPNDLVPVSSNIQPNDMVSVSSNIQANDMVPVSSNIQPNDMVSTSSSKQADWQLPSNILLFLIGIGMDMNTIEEIKSQLPPFENESWAENMKPGIEFLVELGMPHRALRNIIYRFPRLLRFTRDKVKANIDYFYELGISTEDIYRMLKLYPNIIAFSVDNKLRPVAEYFRSIGLNPSVFFRKCPPIVGRSLEHSVKPTTQFFLERGYSMDDTRALVLRYPRIYAFSVEKNLIPKWDFFLTMDYPRSELVKCPQYFGCNLEETIIPRYEQLKQSGVKMSLTQVFGSSHNAFEKALNYKMNEMIDNFLKS